MEERGKRKVRVGRVVSAKRRKTVTVEIERLVRHAEFGRYVRRKKRFAVHDEENQCKEGDVIRFMETRPLSKTKRWRFVSFVEHAK
jgi:small subunit ribosomal protein S17